MKTVQTATEIEIDLETAVVLLKKGFHVRILMDTSGELDPDRASNKNLLRQIEGLTRTVSYADAARPKRNRRVSMNGYQSVASMYGMALKGTTRFKFVEQPNQFTSKSMGGQVIITARELGKNDSIFTRDELSEASAKRIKVNKRRLSPFISFLVQRRILVPVDIKEIIED